MFSSSSPGDQVYRSIVVDQQHHIIDIDTPSKKDSVYITIDPALQPPKPVRISSYCSSFSKHDDDNVQTTATTATVAMPELVEAVRLDLFLLFLLEKAMNHHVLDRLQIVQQMEPYFRTGHLQKESGFRAIWDETFFTAMVRSDVPLVQRMIEFAETYGFDRSPSREYPYDKSYRQQLLDMLGNAESRKQWRSLIPVDYYEAPFNKKIVRNNPTHILEQQKRFDHVWFGTPV
jgi:hypothetical protein